MPAKRKRYACDLRLTTFQVREAQGPQMKSASDFANEFREAAWLDREAFFAVTLSQKHTIIDKHLVALGTLTASLVHPREIFRCAIQDSAAAVALLHCHPSGDPTPSHDDRAITRRLKEAGDLLGIRVIDHIVLGRNKYVSFVDEGLL